MCVDTYIMLFSGRKMLKLLLGLSVVAVGCLKTTHASSDLFRPTVVPEDNSLRFDCNLWTVVAEENPGNVIISPIIIKILLNMLYEGTSGDTAQELKTILNIPESKDESRLKIGRVLESLQAKDPSYELEFLTNILVDRRVTFELWYEKILNRYYNSSIKTMVFYNKIGNTLTINYLVEKVTERHIKDVVTNDDFVGSVMILLSVIYFKGSWMSPFFLKYTFSGDFQTADGLKQVEYMKQINYFYYTKSPEIKAQILWLPYVGQKFAMYIILPEKKDGVNDLIKTVTPFFLRKHVAQMNKTAVEVILPKFNLQFKSELKDSLGKLGVDKIFHNSEDMIGFRRFPQYFQFRRRYVDKIIQKAGIEVNEEGRMETAASGVTNKKRSHGAPELFNASHPFIFFIKDETTGTMVFAGKFMHPETEF